MSVPTQSETTKPGHSDKGLGLRNMVKDRVRVRVEIRVVGLVLTFPVLSVQVLTVKVKVVNLYSASSRACARL